MGCQFNGMAQEGPSEEVACELRFEGREKAIWVLSKVCEGRGSGGAWEGFKWEECDMG